jgi:hypothetical protein
MRKVGWTLASIGGLLIVGTMSGLACSNSADDCEENRTCTGSGATGTTSGTGGNTGECVPDVGKEIPESCGVFLALSGDDNNDGSMGAPVATFAKAIELAGSTKRVYACAEEFKEAVKVPAGISLYGGLDCAASWAYVGNATKTKIAPAADMVALTVSGSDGTSRIADIEARAADATLPGGSSVAAIMDGATVELVRLSLIAGAGLDGENGTTPEPVGPVDSTDPAIKGEDGTVACSIAAETPGAAAKSNMSCDTSIGGAGGNGLEANGTAGGDGQPLPNPNPDMFGLGGAGAAASLCKVGGSGNIGADGAAGAGASALGMLTSTGFVSADGQPGSPGSPGQGGGGGGGAKGKAGCAGASGGSGGAGGCGGPGGLGGKGGGSSIALISLSATVTVTEVTITTGTAGRGGNGGDGQYGGVGGVGGIGGAGAQGTVKGCTGGEGGPGGFGGKGGGGRGGHSIGIAFSGAEPTIDDATFTLGGPGAGGTGLDMATNGGPGVAAEKQPF